MLLKYFFDQALAHASYLVGCQRTGEAIVIDPGRNIELYMAAAEAEGLRITGSAETHIHADFVSGSRELAERCRATLYLSDEGPADWKYGYPAAYPQKLLKDGSRFTIGRVRFDVMHTPGHTPESISYLLTDEGGGASAPMGLFTGDFVFVGAIGRPDLLETAAGVAGSAESGARQLFQSIERFRKLADHLQIWPAHGAGSACGKGLGAVPSSTVGYEKLFNPALQFNDEQAFVDYILADQPETPFYFAVMKRVNKTGPELLKNLPEISLIDPAKITALVRDHLVIDTSPTHEFARGHVPGTINIPPPSLVRWGGFLVNYDQPLYLIGGPAEMVDIVHTLRSIGIDKVGGYFSSEQLRQAGLRTETYRTGTPDELRGEIERGQASLIDVRAASEFQAGHIPDAEHFFLGHLLRRLGDLDRSKPIVAQCQAGNRSAIAASILQRAGFEVVNMLGGFQAWSHAGFPIEQGSQPSASSCQSKTRGATQRVAH